MPQTPKQHGGPAPALPPLRDWPPPQGMPPPQAYFGTDPQTALPWANSGRDPLPPRVTPALSAQLSGRMTPFFSLMAVRSYPRPLPPPCPCRQCPGPKLDPCSPPSPPLHTRAHTHTQSPQRLRHQASAVLLESVSGSAGAGRPPAPEAQGPCMPSGPPRVCPGCLGNHFRSFEMIKSLNSVLS